LDEKKFAELLLILLVLSISKLKNEFES